MGESLYKNKCVLDKMISKKKPHFQMVNEVKERERSNSRNNVEKRRKLDCLLALQSKKQHCILHNKVPIKNKN